MPTRGKRLTVIIASVAIVVLAIATWQAWRLWPQIVFRWRFEALGANAEGYQEYRHRQTGIVFVRLPGGTFNMGSPDDEPCHQSDEGPVHEVTLSPFLIAKYEVTQGEWSQVMGSNPSWFQGDRLQPDVQSDTLPVEQVSWEDVQRFEKKTGLLLPTEAQWEYACRAGTKTAFSFGSGERCADWEYAPCPERDAEMWYWANSRGRTHEVGTKLSNSFGLYDIHGNVSEWVEDVYGENFYSMSEAIRQDPLCASGSGGRVIRGGCWFSGAGNCRSACRNWDHPSDRDPIVSFRAAYRPLP